MKYLASSSLAAMLSVFTFAIIHLIWFGSPVNSSTFYGFSVITLMFGYVGGFIGFLYLSSQRNKPLFTFKNFLVFLATGILLGSILEWVAADGPFIGFLMASIVGALSFFFGNGIKSPIINLVIIPLPFIIVFGFPFLDSF